MKPILLFIIALPFIYFGQNNSDNTVNAILPDSVRPFYKTAANIPPPVGYERITAGDNSFAYYLRNLPLKKNNTIYLFNGQPKKNQQAQFAVLDIPVGNKDLQQCADAAMRLRAEYLFAQKRYDEISFIDNNLKAYAFSQPFTREHLEKYLPIVFANCGTASLAKQLKTISNFEDIQPGDVLIKGGSPGHAVTVMDVAVNKLGKKAYILAQSYMPAQDIHILNNPKYNGSNPWYIIENERAIYTPEWVFYTNQLKKW